MTVWESLPYKLEVNFMEWLHWATLGARESLGPLVGDRKAAPRPGGPRRGQKVGELME